MLFSLMTNCRHVLEFDRTPYLMSYNKLHFFTGKKCEESGKTYEPKAGKEIITVEEERKYSSNTRGIIIEKLYCIEFIKLFENKNILHTFIMCFILNY